MSRSMNSERMTYQDATELDKQLVRATEAAIGASFSLIEDCGRAPAVELPRPKQCRRIPERKPDDSNANNTDGTCDLAVKRQFGTSSSGGGVGGVGGGGSGGSGGPKRENRSQARNKQPKSLRQKMGSLLAYVTRRSGSSNRGNRCDCASREAATATFQETQGHCGGRGASSRRAAVCHDQHCRSNEDRVFVLNASNTPLMVDAAIQEDVAAEEQLYLMLPKEESGETLEPLQQRQSRNFAKLRQSRTSQIQDGPEESARKSKASQVQESQDEPVKKVSLNEDELNAAAQAAFTTSYHRRMQEAFLRECRIVPLDSFYKKVALVPGRERLFLSAPKNFRTVGSPLLYDIAKDNYRHHSDCNRDFIRAGLKKICPSYCRPSQFRYVY